MTNLPEKAYYRPDEIAEYFGVRTRTIYVWIESGKLPAVKIAGKIIRISRESVSGIIRPAE